MALSRLLREYNRSRDTAVGSVLSEITLITQTLPCRKRHSNCYSTRFQGATEGGAKEDVARRFRSPLAVARKLFGLPCKLITTFKSSNISRRSSPRLDEEVAVGVVARDRRGRKRKRAFARGNFRSYKKSYHSAAVRVRLVLLSLARRVILLFYRSPLCLSFSRPLPLSPFFFSPAASLRALVAPSPKPLSSARDEASWLFTFRALLSVPLPLSLLSALRI